MERIKQISQSPFLRNLVYFLSGLAGTVSLIQSWGYLHSLESNLDEGAYLLKGYMFATGKYIPYQFYGFWTNQMPFAFLIPGIIQKLFGPGLAVGRYFMLIVFGFSLIGLWIVTRRLNGIWGAWIALAIVALNPALIKMYSTAVSQGLTACILTWTIVFSLGKNRPFWQLLIASFLSSILVLIRVNMLPVPVFLIIYILWQYGWQKGIMAFLTIFLTVIIVHALYWPNILQVYVRWIPSGIFPLIDTFRIKHTAVGIWHPDLSIENRLVSLFRTFRFHFLYLIGSIASLMIFQNKLIIDQRSRWRDFVFLFFLFWTLFFAHAWVTLHGDYCNYCLEGYLSFFAPLGIVLTISTFPYWHKKYSTWIEVLLILVILMLSAGIGIGLIDDFHFGILYISLPRFLLKFPRFESGWFLPVEVLRNLAPFLSDRQTHILDIILTSVIIGIIFEILVYGFWKILIHSGLIKTYLSFGYVLLLSLLVTALVIGPTSFMSGGRYTYDCRPNTLDSYETTGRKLAQLIPPHSKVFWKSMAATPLLYIPDIQIYPPQINDVYSFYLKGNDNELLKLGLWNESLARQWLGEADYIIIEDRYFNGFYREVLKNGNYKLLTVLPPQSPCRENSRLRIYQPVRRMIKSLNFWGFSPMSYDKVTDTFQLPLAR